MAYGIIEFDVNGNPICEICKKPFKRVLTHVRQKHHMNEREYKKQFGFNLKKGICSQESSELSRQRVLDNADLCIGLNLLVKGENTRVKKGNKIRTKANTSEQTRLMLKERLKQPYMQEAMKKSGERLGKSGIGNKKRWGNKNN